MSLILSPAPHVRTKNTTQRLMLNVVISLLPCAAAGIYYFGLRAAIVLAVSVVSAVLAELVWQKLAHQTVRITDCSAVVTGLLLGLCITPSAPWWMVMIGAFFAIIVVKQLFGGIGDNFLNPALTARAVLLASWPALMTTHCTPFDAVTSEVARLLGFVDLLVTQTIRWEIPVFTVAAAALLSWALGLDPLTTVLSGGLLFGAVYMATDYVTSPLNRWAQIVYAIGIGVIVVIIRKFGAYPEGVTYAILLMNIAAPLLDRVMPQKIYGCRKARKEAK